jgi:hypothetical protein
MNFENRPTNSLRPYPGNARTHSPKQIKQIARSIDRFGFNNPVWSMTMTRSLRDTGASRRQSC